MEKLIVSIFALFVSVFAAFSICAGQMGLVSSGQTGAKLENGIIGKPLAIQSANPRNFEEIISKNGSSPVKLQGQLFLPAGGGPHGVVILIPGSGGMGEDHLRHAKELTSAGLGAYVLDPFGGRGVKDTISDQMQFTFAASAYDVLAASRVLAEQPGIDGRRIGAVGYSRGGAAVLLAAHRQVARAVLGEGKSLRAVLAGFPWCGYQFENALTAPTVVRFLVGDSDNWVSPVQCQGQAAAMRAHNSQVSIRIFKGAHHAFGYDTPLSEIPNAMKAYNAPIAYINDQGTFLDFYTGKPLPGADDAYMSGVGAPWMVRGPVTLGSKPGQSEEFVHDMISFFKIQLKL